jgi:dienelactone hydrolase
MTVAAATALSTTPAWAEDAQGYWTGSVGNVRVIVQFNKLENGSWEATVSAPAQRLTAKVEDLVVTPDQISFSLRNLRASYKATWNEEAHAWAGTWTQGRTTTLNLQRSAREELKPKRPQEDEIAASPSPYSNNEVSFSNDAAAIRLYGTLTVPDGKGPFPAVVLVQGSGPLNRDSDVLGHKTFLVLADYLSRRGIAVLRYDKRGVGKSNGNLREATTLDLATDAEAAVRYLRSRPEVDSRHIGVLGHSEGGLISPLLASRDAQLAFAVMLAGPGIRGDRLLVEQMSLKAQAQGAPEQTVAKRRLLFQDVFAAMVAEPSVEGANSKAAAILDAAERQGDMPAGSGRALVQQYGTPWFHAMLSYDPSPALQAVRQPILVLNGELDRQVPAAIDLAAIRTALRDNPHAVVKEMPGLNHLFQTARTGAIAEYGEIPETMAPSALEAIAGWIAATVR